MQSDPVTNTFRYDDHPYLKHYRTNKLPTFVPFSSVSNRCFCLAFFLFSNYEKRTDGLEKERRRKKSKDKKKLPNEWTIRTLSASLLIVSNTVSATSACHLSEMVRGKFLYSSWSASVSLIPLVSSSSKEPISKASAAFTSPRGGISGGVYFWR